MEDSQKAVLDYKWCLRILIYHLFFVFGRSMVAVNNILSLL